LWCVLVKCAFWLVGWLLLSENEMQNEQDHLPLLRQQHKVIFTKEYSFKFIFLFGICTL